MYKYLVLIIDRDIQRKLVLFVRLFTWFRYMGLMKDTNKRIFNEKCNCFNERCGILRGYTFPRIRLFLMSWWWFVNQLDIIVCKWICGKCISGIQRMMMMNKNQIMILTFILSFFFHSNIRSWFQWKN